MFTWTIKRWHMHEIKWKRCESYKVLWLWYTALPVSAAVNEENCGSSSSSSSTEIQFLSSIKKVCRALCWTALPPHSYRQIYIYCVIPYQIPSCRFQSLYFVKQVSSLVCPLYSTYVPLLVCSWHLCTDLHILILDLMSYFDLVGWHSFWKKKNKFGRWLSGWRNYPWRAIKRMLTVLSLSIKLDAQFHHEINHQSEDGTT